MIFINLDMVGLGEIYIYAFWWCDSFSEDTRGVYQFFFFFSKKREFRLSWIFICWVLGGGERKRGRIFRLRVFRFSWILICQGGEGGRGGKRSFFNKISSQLIFLSFNRNENFDISEF